MVVALTALTRDGGTLTAGGRIITEASTPAESAVLDVWNSGRSIRGRRYYQTRKLHVEQRLSRTLDIGDINMGRIRRLSVAGLAMSTRIDCDGRSWPRFSWSENCGGGGLAPEDGGGVALELDEEVFDPGRGIV